MSRAGTLARHARPNAVSFERPCPGSGGPGRIAAPAQYTQPADGDPIIAILCDRRETLGLLQRDVAAVAGCHTQHYGHIERGVISPQLRTLRGVLAALGLDLTVRATGTKAAEVRRTPQVVRLEAELAELRSRLANDRTSQVIAEQRQQIERLAAESEQRRVRAVAAEETVTEVREVSRRLRKEVIRLTESRDRAQLAAQDATHLRAELDQANAELRRVHAALDALARQPVLTHDLIDRARAAIAGTVV